MSRRRRNKIPHEPLKLGDFLHALLSRSNICLEYCDANIASTWTKAVGPQIAAQTEPYKYSNKTLFVHVSTSAWLMQLHFMKQDIVKKINTLTESHSVNDLFFSVGHISVRQMRSGAGDMENRAPVLSDRDLKLIRESTEHIRDEELQLSIRRAMKKNIVNRKIHGNL